VIRYLITDGSAPHNPGLWLENLERWMRDGVDFVQIREPDLMPRELVTFVRRVCAIKAGTRVLVNDRTDVAIAAGADGVHLRDGSIEPERVRRIVARRLFVSVSCHSIAGVKAAARSGADLAILAPIFPPLSKISTRPPLGLETLRKAAFLDIPVIALGGVTQANAGACVEAGAAGVGGISLFQIRANQNQ
jgi:thiamine-phosphate pyrophosphorylase